MIKPLKDMVVIKPLEANKTSSGIILPENVKQEVLGWGSNPAPIQRAEVMAIGSEVTDIEIGDVVYVSKDYGTEHDGLIIYPFKCVEMVEVRNASNTNS